MHRRAVQAVEDRAQKHGDGDRRDRDLGAVGGALGEFGVGLQFSVETGRAKQAVIRKLRSRRVDRTIGIVGAIGIVVAIGLARVGRIAYCHDMFLLERSGQRLVPWVSSGNRLHFWQARLFRMEPESERRNSDHEGKMWALPPTVTALHVLSLVALTAQAMTAALAAGRRSMDWVGVCLLGCLTALRGGTTRDVFLGHYPLPWVEHPSYLAITAIAAFATVLIARWVYRLNLAFLVL